MPQAQKKEENDQALGRSCGGLTTKVNVVVDAHGNPLEVILTPGQDHDSTQAETLIANYKADFVIADKGYDSDDFIKKIQDQGAVAVIPPRCSRTEQRGYDRALYKERNLVERFFNKVKHYRRLATRYEKTSRNYLAFWQFACALLWIK